MQHYVKSLGHESVVANSQSHLEIDDNYLNQKSFFFFFRKTRNFRRAHREDLKVSREVEDRSMYIANTVKTININASVYFNILTCGGDSFSWW